MQYIKKMSVYLVALLGAAGSSLQNFMAFVLFLGRVTSITGFFIHLSASIASICSGLVNFCININLLNDFANRFNGTQKTYPGKGWQRFIFYAGSFVFITTGILFALTAIAFGSVGPLAMLGIIASVFVGFIMMIQELETWLKAFNEEHEYVSVWQGLKNWWNQLTLGKSVGTFVALGNILALSLFLTPGLGLFLMGFGVPIGTALVVSLVIAFTVGAFTEFYFYNKFLSKFCDEFIKKCGELLNSDYAIVGVVSIIINAGVNAALCYSGVFMLSGLMVSAGFVFPPLVLAIVAAGFGGLASLLLNADFWIDNSKHLVGWFATKKIDKPITKASTVSMTQSLNTACPQNDKNEEPSIPVNVSWRNNISFVSFGSAAMSFLPFQNSVNKENAQPSSTFNPVSVTV